MGKVLIKNGLVITMDAQRRMIQDGAVLVEGNRIAAVGKAGQLDQVADQEIDAQGGLVLPGFIDGHNHPVQYLSKGIGDDIHLHCSLYQRLYPYEANLRPEDVYISALGDFVEMVKYGTTCFTDPGGYHANEVGRAAKEIGIRGILCRSTRDLEDPAFSLPKSLMESTEETVREAEKLVKKWHKAEGDRIRAWFGLRVIYNVSDALARQIKKLADQYQVGIHAHLCGVKEQNEEVKRRWGVRSMERYRRLGLFGPSLYLIHMGGINDEEVDWLKEYDIKVCHCPATSMHGAYGAIAYGMIPKMISKGVTVSLGTDSATSGRFLDMVRQMYLAAAAHKDALASPEVMGAHKALEMATIDGARALLWDDEIGSLEVGKKADLVIIDTRSQCWHPMLDPVANLVYSCSGASVNTVVIDGRVIVEGGRVTTVDENEVMARVDQACQGVLSRAGLRLPPKWPLI